MTHITHTAGRAIAEDITTMFHTTDAALLNGARLATSVLEGTEHSGLNPRSKQKLLEAMNEGFSKMLGSRSDMLRAHREMMVIQRQSNLDVVDFGCLGAPAFMDGGKDAGANVVGLRG